MPEQYSSSAKRDAISLLIPESPSSIVQVKTEPAIEIESPIKPVIEEEPTVEEVEIPDTVFTMNHHTDYKRMNPITGKKEKYYYLSDHVLKQIFGFIEENNEVVDQSIGLSINQTYHIHLGLFHLRMDAKNPFLLFLLEIQNEIFDFPSFEYKPVFETEVSGKAKESVQDDTLQIDFINECLKKIRERYPSIVETINEENRDQFYKGFVSKDKDIYVFFDIHSLITEDTSTEEDVSTVEDTSTEFKENVQSEINTTSNKAWSSLEEIILYQTLLGKPVQPNLATLFKETPELYTIRNRYGNPIPTPHIMYLCEKQDTTIRNYIGNSPTPELLPLLCTIHTPIFGRLYCFTPKPILGYAAGLQRYIGFVEDAIYILREISLDSKEVEEECKEIEDATCIYFRENEQPIWGFRTSADFTLLIP